MKLYSAINFILCLFFFLAFCGESQSIVVNFTILEYGNIRIAILSDIHGRVDDKKEIKQNRELCSSLQALNGHALGIFTEKPTDASKNRLLPQKPVGDFGLLQYMTEKPYNEFTAGILWGIDLVNLVNKLKVPVLIQPCEPAFAKLKLVLGYLWHKKLPVNLLGLHPQLVLKKAELNVLEISFQDIIDECKRITESFKPNELDKNAYQLNKLIAISNTSLAELEDFVSEHVGDANKSIAKTFTRWWWEAIVEGFKRGFPKDMSRLISDPQFTQGLVKLADIEKKILEYQDKYPEVDGDELKELVAEFEDLVQTPLGNEVIQESKIKPCCELFLTGSRYLTDLAMLTKLLKYAHNMQVCSRVIICVGLKHAETLRDFLQNEVGYKLVYQHYADELSCKPLTKNDFNLLVKLIN